MSYGTVVKELARSLGSQIVAYDNLPDHGGCILHITGAVRRIEIEAAALDEGASDLAEFLRKALAAPLAPSTCIGVGVRDGDLALISETARAEGWNAPAGAPV